MLKIKVLHFFELLVLLVQKEIHIRYKRSLLGYAWTLLNPLMFAVVYYLAFKIIMRVQMPDYLVFLLTGMFPWLWLSSALARSTMSYRANANLVKKIKLKREILPFSIVTCEMMHFCFSLPILIAFLIFQGHTVHFAWVWQIPVMIFVELIFITPIAMFLGLVNVYVSDVEYLVGIVLSLLFYLTPIVYHIDMVPEKFSSYYALNPLVPLISCWRDVFLLGKLDLGYLGLSVLFSAVFYALALVIYKKYGAKIGELL